MLYSFLQKTYCSQSNSLGSMLISTLNNLLKMSPEALQKIINTNCEFSPDALNSYLIRLMSNMFHRKIQGNIKVLISSEPSHPAEPRQWKAAREVHTESCNSLFIEWWVCHFSQLPVLRTRNLSSRPQECKLVTLLISTSVASVLFLFFSL